MTERWKQVRVTGLVAAGALAAAVMACSPLAAGAGSQAGMQEAGTEAASIAPAVAVHPVSGLRIIPVTVKTAKHTYTFRAELALTSEQQARGLMFRTQMGPDEGMLFPRNPPGVASFWMRNTLIPLDIIYVGTDGRILNIARAIPHDETPIPSAGIAAGVLELNGGRAAQLGIRPGDLVSW